MPHDEQFVAPVTEKSDPVEWKCHLRATGFRVLRGLDVDICAVRIPEARVVEASQRYLFAVDGVANATTVHDDDRRKASIESAMYDYMNALAWCIGASLYLGAVDGSEMLDELAREVESARDSLHVLAPTHWNANDLHTATSHVERAFLVEGAWPQKFAALSFTYDARATKAA